MSLRAENTRASVPQRVRVRSGRPTIGVYSWAEREAGIENSAGAEVWDPEITPDNRRSKKTARAPVVIAESSAGDSMQRFENFGYTKIPSSAGRRGDPGGQGGRRGQYSIRINYQYRICFERRGGDAYAVEIVDYH